MDFQWISELLDRHGWPALIFVAACMSAWRVWAFLQPLISTGFQKHFGLLDEATESFSKQNKTIDAMAETMSDLSRQIGENHQQVIKELRRD